LTEEVESCYFDAEVVLREDNGHLGGSTMLQVEPTFNVRDRRLPRGPCGFETVPTGFGVTSLIQYVLVKEMGNVGVF
jgi:hypothetical protein